MKDPINSIKTFCLIQIEIQKDRELRLRKGIEDTITQREFLQSLLRDLGHINMSDPKLIDSLLREIKKETKGDKGQKYIVIVYLIDLATLGACTVLRTLFTEMRLSCAIKGEEKLSWRETTETRQ